MPFGRVSIALAAGLLAVAQAAEVPSKRPPQAKLSVPTFAEGTAPAEGGEYPRFYDMADILTAWSPLDPVPPASSGPGVHSSLRYFDYETERDTIVEFMKRELPFVVRNIPSLEASRVKWTDEYLISRFGERRLPVMESSSVHHMYGRNGNKFANRRRKSGKGSGLKLGGGNGNHTLNLNVGATKRHDMDFAQWKSHSIARDERIKAGREPGPTYYARFSAPKWSFVTKDLKYFDTNWSPGDEGEVFVSMPKANRGVHCRVGMTGIIAESHYDHGRNFVSMIRGRKRYILNPPSECSRLPMILQGKSSRHASTDWSDPAEAANFRGVRALEVIMTPGDALFIPAFWFHYIISLEENIQCNSRTDTPTTGLAEIRACGFSARSGGRMTPPLPSFENAVRSYPLKG